MKWGEGYQRVLDSKSPQIKQITIQQSNSQKINLSSQFFDFSIQEIKKKKLVNLTQSIKYYKN